LSYRPKPPPTKTTSIPCKTSCQDLAIDLGTMTSQELDEWQRSLVDQKKAAGFAPEENAAVQHEINCVLKWRNECEPVLSEPTDDCDKLRDSFQSGSSQPLPKEARNLIANNAMTKIDNVNLPRNEVVAAQRQLNNLLSYEDCLGKYEK
jgi:hypothetical protein